MVKLLHSVQFLHVALCLFPAVLALVYVPHPVLVKLLPETSQRIVERLHRDCVLLYKLLDGLYFNILLHLDGCQALTHHIRYHPPRDVVELVIKVGFFEFLQSFVHL